MSYGQEGDNESTTRTLPVVMVTARGRRGEIRASAGRSRLFAMARGLIANEQPAKAPADHQRYEPGHPGSRQQVLAGVTLHVELLPQVAAELTDGVVELAALLGGAFFKNLKWHLAGHVLFSPDLNWHALHLGPGLIAQPDLVLLQHLDGALGREALRFHFGPGKHGAYSAHDEVNETDDEKGPGKACHAAEGAGNQHYKQPGQQQEADPEQRQRDGKHGNGDLEHRRLALELFAQDLQARLDKFTQFEFQFADDATERFFFPHDSVSHGSPSKCVVRTPPGTPA